MLDLEPIKARLAAATEWPWNEASWQLGQVNFADACLIAHAPTDIAALLVELQTLRRFEDDREYLAEKLECALEELERLRAWKGVAEKCIEGFRHCTGLIYQEQYALDELKTFDCAVELLRIRG